MIKKINILKKEFKDIIGIIKLRNFKGNKGIAIKNSFFNLSKTLIAKIGGLLSVILLARFLMPELFGIYSLVMATIFIFISFADLGISSALVRFVSRALGKKDPQKAKGYTKYLFKLELILVLIIIGFSIFSAKFIANNYYHQPLFLPLIIGSLYIFSLPLTTFLESIFFSVGKFKEPVNKEIIFQVFRLIFIIIILFFIKKSLPEEFLIFLIVFSIALSSFLGLVYLFFAAKKKISFLKTKLKKIKKNERKELKNFMIPLTIIGISGLFLGNMDIIMLGYFVRSEFIGYYSAVLFLIGSFTALLSFSVVLFPIFSRLKGIALNKALKKSVNATLIISGCLIILVIIFSPFIIKLIYGSDYINSIILLRILAFSFIPTSIIAIYNSYFISKGRTKLVAQLLIPISILNIILNYVLITILLKTSSLAASIGVAGGTVVSLSIHLGLLVFFSKKK